jgi:kynurenine formamidase
MQPIDFEELANRVRNWGRWGDDDQRGTINHITPSVLQRAASQVSAGKLFNLGLNFDKDGPQLGIRRFNPKLYMIELGKPLNPDRPDGGCFNDDVIHMPLQAATQWDAIGHVHYDGTLYNNCKACDVLSVEGTTQGAIHHLAAPGIMSRGVLLDIAKLKGVDELPVDCAISPDDLDAACTAQGVQIESGDVVLVRTGHMRRFTVHKDRVAFCGLQPGVSTACAEWLYEHNIAAVAADNLAVEVIPPGMAQQHMPLPFHMLALRDMGCPLGEMFNFETLALDCAQDGKYSFLFSAPPLAITGAFGSPVNPLVLK